MSQIKIERALLFYTKENPLYNKVILRKEGVKMLLRTIIKS